ncbi:Rne/Rng family ribonuclease [Brachybacterium sp. ACRRE]|uniref:Rne/Rng family ribonuclease n=1 Tax=Brachybacterium sp. ACRRE TaxID=2918184 RepID=UPI001EF1CF88|nr:Rne/Rng family ribonuclease [Brachybacterium sp. ACRRE]MCG7309194.1 Rne/Rng family ribonuclease [Brachybacterium sp. ACRRE]
MAEDISTPETSASQETPSTTSGTGRAKRPRRRAGSPVGAPQHQETAPEADAPQRHTTVAAQQTPPSEPAPAAAEKPATRRRRRAAGAPAGPPVAPVAPAETVEADAEPAVTETVAEPAPETDAAADAADETVDVESTETAPEDSEDDAETASDAPAEADSERPSGVAADLQALAENRPQEPKRAVREQTQIDFASLIFQAPTPEKRTTVPEQRAGHDDEDHQSGSAELSFGTASRGSRRRRATRPQSEAVLPEQEQAPADGEDAAEVEETQVSTDEQAQEGQGGRGRGSRGRRSSSRRRRGSSRGESSEDASGEENGQDAGEDRRTRRDGAQDDVDADASGADEENDSNGEEEDGQSSGSSRRRRRRGGRGRRGRGRGEDSADREDEDSRDDDERSEDTSDDASERATKDGKKSSADNSEDRDSQDGEDQGKDEDGSSGGSSSRRRRRRRRSGSSSNSENGPSPDDPPNTVVKVREARDEVKAVKGSTRLEAKKQRRREGRDQGRRRNVITEAEFLARRESVKRSMVVRERKGSTQIAVLEDDILVEHYVAQKSHTSMVGNVYLGKVQNVLPSMEAAFVDIGKGRNAVLYAGEVNWDAAGLEGQPRRIELALSSGDPVLVQVTKDPIGHKGARLTSQISLPGRYVVFVPGGSMTGISRKLPDAERSRLKKIMKQVIPEDAGVIVRTASEGASEEELTRDVERLRKQWDRIQKAQKSKSAPASLSQEPDLAIKVVRDVFNEDFTSLIVEGEGVYSDVHEYVSDVAPDLLERVTKHVGEKDVFAKHRIDEQLLKAMDRKVYLPSGGSLVIDRTEAMTVIDVNTGKFTGAGGSLEETVTKNNIEAAEEIVRQLRLRDIGGIIVIDFIDMVLEANRDLVLRRLVECLGRDRTKHQVAEVTSLGLVQMTRKRVGAGLVETFSTTCEACAGRGMIVDLDGVDTGHQHHGGQGSQDDDSSKGGRRRKGKSKGGSGSSGNGSNGGGNGGNGSSGNGSGGGNGGSDRGSQSAKEAVEELTASTDVHRLESDSASRALARATIASIAAATGSKEHPEVVVDGEAVTVEADAAQAAGDTPEQATEVTPDAADGSASAEERDDSAADA